MIRGKKISEGAYGIVYSASLGQEGEYAVKRNLSDTKTDFIGCLRELDMLSKVKGHPCIIDTKYVSIGNPFVSSAFSPLMGQERTGQRDDSVHFVFEVSPYDLHNLVHEQRVEPNFAQLKRYMLHVLLAVEFMHGRGIVHRDVKTNNVLIFPNEEDPLPGGTGGVAKVCDLGLAKPYTLQGESTPNVMCSWYRAPEVALGCPHYGYPIDMWSLGCLFFEMVARKRFVGADVTDNDMLVSRILSRLPRLLPNDTHERLIQNNPWRTVKLQRIAWTRRRYTWRYQLGLSEAGETRFEQEAGTVASFESLLDGLLTFDPAQRLTASAALQHPFFASERGGIDLVLKKYPPVPLAEQKMLAPTCEEREWGLAIASSIFRSRERLSWYSHRALFLGMDLYDRYLGVMFHYSSHLKGVPSKYTGRLHTRHEAELRFLVCLYMAVKYYSSIYPSPSYHSLVSPEYRTPEALAVVEEFEISFLRSCLEYRIYRPSLYETADRFHHVLTEEEVERLFDLYQESRKLHGYYPSQVFKREFPDLIGTETEVEA